jgi:hypothetical protein
MTISDAARLVNKTERTVSRWISDGCQLDKESLLLWSQRKDSRSRGRTRQLYYEREELAYGVTSRLSPIGEKPTPVASYFVGVTEDDFINLPCPVSTDAMSHVVALLDEIREAFDKRLTELKAIGHAMTIETVEGDIQLKRTRKALHPRRISQGNVCRSALAQRQSAQALGIVSRRSQNRPALPLAERSSTKLHFRQLELSY